MLLARINSPNANLTMRRHRWMSVVLALTAAGTIQVSAADANAPGSPIDLGTLGGNTSSAVAVSGNLVVGTSTIPGEQARHAFAYDFGVETPSMEDLGTLGGDTSFAAAVDGDIVVGSSSLPGIYQQFHAFVYDTSSGTPSMRDIGTLGGTFSAASGISGSVVVGTSEMEGDLESRAFVYDLADLSPAMRDLGTLGGSNSDAAGIVGHVVFGSSETADGVRHAFAYDLAAVSPFMRDLGSLGSLSIPNGAAGSVVVGQSWKADGTRHAFAYDLDAPEASMIDLGVLGSGTFSVANAVSGQTAVGYSTLAPGSLSPPSSFHHAFAYDFTSDTMQDLGTLGGAGSQATGISGNMIVGHSNIAGGSRRAFAYDLGSTVREMRNLGTLGGDHSQAAAVDFNLAVGSSSTGGGTHAAAWRIPLAVRVLDDADGPRKGSFVQVRVQLLDSAGNNVSSPSTAITVMGLAPPVSGPTPTGSFRYGNTKEGPGYIFSVKVKGYDPGLYVLSFTVGDDPVSHSATFLVE